MSGPRDIKHGPWLWMSKAGLDRARSAGGPTAVAVYAGICRLESDAPAKIKDCFHASARNIADVSGVSTRTVETYLPLLSKAGLLLIKSGRKAGVSGAHESNQFRILNVGCPSAAVSEASANETRVNCGQKRNFSRREKEVSSETKETGSAAGLSADAEASALPLKKPRCSGEAFING